MSMDQRVAAFIEYVVRPLSEDWRLILQEAKALNIGVTQQTVKEITIALSLWHLTGEILRAITYIAITWLVCHTIQSIL